MKEENEIYDQCYYLNEMVALQMLIIKSNDNRGSLNT
jgi:hypothetical protein